MATIEETGEHLAELNREHERRTTPGQRLAVRVTDLLSKPVTLGAVMMMIAIWIVGNKLALQLGYHSLEDFPYPLLELVGTIAAVLVALLILSTQQHEDRLAERRAQLTLQIALLSEKKIAKVVALIEEQRDENPLLKSRTDEEALVMARPANPQESLRSLQNAEDAQMDK